MQTLDRIPAPERRPETAGRYLRLGLWLRGSIVGAAFATAGFAALLARPHAFPALTALTWVAAGATFSWLSWQRARALLDRMATDEIAQPDGDLGFRARPVLRTSASS
jgi:hypothetical protein